MDLFWKGIGAVLLSSTLCILTGKLEGSYRQIIALAGYIAASMICVAYLKDIVHFWGKLEQLASIQTTTLKILLKTVGIGIVSEIASSICKDNGSSGLGKAIQLLGNITIIWISIPTFEGLMELLQRILGEL